MATEHVSKCTFFLGKAFLRVSFQIRGLAWRLAFPSRGRGDEPGDQWAGRGPAPGWGHPAGMGRGHQPLRACAPASLGAPPEDRAHWRCSLKTSAQGGIEGSLQTCHLPLSLEGLVSGCVWGPDCRQQMWSRPVPGTENDLWPEAQLSIPLGTLLTSWGLWSHTAPRGPFGRHVQEPLFPELWITGLIAVCSEH